MVQEKQLSWVFVMVSKIDYRVRPSREMRIAREHEMHCEMAHR